MKAIETYYKGYRFRSRLEARWAVFLDAMEEKWEYERQGYDLDGTWYLPDFWLPRLNCYIEIKGTEPTDEEMNKARLLRDQVGCAVAVFQGVPGEYPGFFYCWDQDILGAGPWAGEICLGNDCDGELIFGVPGPEAIPRRVFSDSACKRQLDFAFGWVPCVKTDYAANKAKAARFEHEECTIPKANYWHYDDDDDEKTGECIECGRAIKPRFDRCYSCSQAYSW